ncbi:MAG: LuxR family transcriptional regulator [Boseongicola sp.]|nr:LuxR family transcriptional regulator [Boseongicola sp.]
MNQLLGDPVSTLGDAAEKDAIIAAINTETQTFADANFEAWAACWVQDERVKNVCVSSIGQSVISGWQNVQAEMKHALVHGGGCGMVRFRQTNFEVTIDRQTAWVTFDQWAEDKDGGTWDSFETRILERVKGDWKIAFIMFLEKHYDRIARNGVCVDDKGHLVWATPETLDTLKHHPHLTVSAGRIRARQRSWDRTLQTALGQASRYHGFFEQWRFTQENGRPFHYPVVLGESDEGRVVVVHVSVRDNSTFLLFDGDGSLDRRLAVAQAVFGLSDGQLKVARHIADGVGVKGAADALGISVNTARTHLARLYAKTGVNSQTALVRLLLSVG